MTSNGQKEMPPVLERYELKYVIPKELIEPISSFVSTYCSQDKYSLHTANGYYKVNTLYLDSSDYVFVRMRMEGAEKRFYMRVRSYGDHPKMPYFLEIKQKIRNVVRKYRAPVKDGRWHWAYTKPGCELCEENGNPAEAKNRSLFQRLFFTYNVSPKLMIQYLRKAWVSDVDDYARVTFDIDLRFMPETEYNLVPREEEMAPCDPVAVLEPGYAVILELKCHTSQVPLWMIDMIKYFDLERQSISKYMAGATELFGLYRYDAVARVAGTHF
ncbi:MAG: polyphosphate polymerase domain-containing protein [Thermodesulfobacteriota bacterium]|nr:polyphosphate polymerase domain-containing protein [Thermodesulfobacteriota bacterium]